MTTATLLRIAWAVLAALVVWFGLPWLLSVVFGITWPQPIIGILAVLAFLIVFMRSYWWPTRGAPVA